MPREPGVGAELNSPPAEEDHLYNSDKLFTQQGDFTQEEKVLVIKVYSCMIIKCQIERMNQHFMEKSLVFDTLCA